MASTTSHPPHKTRSHPVRALSTTIGVAILLATLFTALPSQGLANGDFYKRVSLLLTPHNAENVVFTPQPQLRIGIVAGHSGNDSGAVCVDGNGTVTLTEADVNLEIAAIVQQKLIEAGYQVDLLNEFDTRLN